MESDPPPSREKSSHVNLWLILSGIIALILVLNLSHCIFSAPRNARVTQQKKTMRSLILVCYAYEDDHGRFPDRLEDLQTANFIDTDFLFFTELTASGQPKRLRYFPGPSRTSDPARPVILTPEAIDGTYLVAYSDGFIVSEPADKVAEWLKPAEPDRGKP